MSQPHSELRPRTASFISWVAVVALLMSVPTAIAQPNDPYAEARLNMVENVVAAEGIKNPSLLRAMRSVPRHLFCKLESRSSAYSDQSLPIGHNQTMSSPFIVATMIDLLDPRPRDRVLEIGTGSGYQAAVLSEMVKEVYTIEIIEALGKSASDLLKRQRYQNVYPRIADGYRGWPEHAPFDKIIVDCSPADVPRPLIDQLREGGRLIIPLSTEEDVQELFVYEKEAGELVKKELNRFVFPLSFAPMQGIADVNRKAQKVHRDPARPVIQNGGFEQEENERPKKWHYQRQLTHETGAAPEGKAFVTFTNREAGRAASARQALEIDGSQVASLQIDLQVKGQNLKFGAKPLECPALLVQYYDADRNPLKLVSVGPWEGTFSWTAASKVIPVPENAHSAILCVGLNGGTGSLSVDDVQAKGTHR